MSLTIRRHAGSSIVAVGVVVAAMFEGSFDPSAYGAASIVIWAAVLAGLVSRVLPFARVAAPAAIAGLCLLGAVILSMSSVAWASDQGGAYQEAVRASAYLGLFVLAACTATPGARRGWIVGLTVGVTAVSVIAVVSRLQPGLVDEGSLPNLLPGARARLFYPIGYWNALGALMSLAVVLLAYAGAREPSPRLRAAAIAAIPIPVLGIFHTTSRGAALTAVVGLAVLIGLGPGRVRQLVVALIGCAGGLAAILATIQMDALRDGLTDAAARSQGNWASLIVVAAVAITGTVAWLADGWEPSFRPSRRQLLAAGVAIAVVAVVGLALLDPPERFREFKQEPAASSAGVPSGGEFSGSGRWQYWGEAMAAFGSRPLAGIGSGGFADWWAQHAPINQFSRNPHSLPLQQLAELGLLGMGLLIGFLVAVGVALWRRLAAGIERDTGVLAAALAAGLLPAAGDWTWEIPAVFGPTLVAAGLLCAAAPGPRRERNPFALGVAAVATAWAAMVAAGLLVLTEVKLDQSRSDAAEGRLPQAIERADEARMVQPWSAEPYLQLALLQEEAGNPAVALGRLDQAIARDGRDWRLALIEARLRFDLGDASGGRRAFERAGTLSPRFSGAGGE